MSAKILASLTAIIGALTVIYSILGAWGIELSQAQQDSLTGLAGLVLILAGIWAHPDIPIGTTEEKPPTEPTP